MIGEMNPQVRRRFHWAEVIRAFLAQVLHMHIAPEEGMIAEKRRDHAVTGIGL